jgi:hypothetical protein
VVKSLGSAAMIVPLSQASDHREFERRIEKYKRRQLACYQTSR